jgi:hypothetical protein
MTTERTRTNNMLTDLVRTIDIGVDAGRSRSADTIGKIARMRTRDENAATLAWGRGTPPSLPDPTARPRGGGQPHRCPSRHTCLPLATTTVKHELDAIVTVIDDLADPLQRAALLLLRWSAARRDEILRLTWDCLDSYPGGHPRLRIPVGKAHNGTDRPAAPVFIRRGKLLSVTTLFDEAFRIVCGASGLVDDRGSPTVSAHGLRHTLGTQLAEGGARIQTIMAILGRRARDLVRAGIGAGNQRPSSHRRQLITSGADNGRSAASPAGGRARPGATRQWQDRHGAGRGPGAHHGTTRKSDSFS